MTNSQVTSGGLITASKLNEFTVGSSAPTGPLNTHSLWMDTSLSIPVLKRWNGSSWTPLQLSGTTPTLVASSGDVSYNQDTSYNTVINASLSPTVATTQYGLVISLTIRQTVTMTVQTAWRYSLRLNTSSSYTVADETITSQQPGVYTVTAYVHRMPVTGIGSNRVGTFFQGAFVADNATPGATSNISAMSAVMAYLNGTWSTISVGIYPGIGGNQASYLVGPLYVWRVGA